MYSGCQKKNLKLQYTSQRLDVVSHSLWWFEIYIINLLWINFNRSHVCFVFDIVEETPVISSQPVPSTAEPVAQTLHEQNIKPESSPPSNQHPPEVPLEGITVVKEHGHGKI